jgi:hypothetical protein
MLEPGNAGVFNQLDSEAILDRRPARAAESVLAIVGDHLACIAFDPDFLDASQVPAVHTPAIIGPDMRFTSKLFQGLMDKVRNGEIRYRRPCNYRPSGKILPGER